MSEPFIISVDGSAYVVGADSRTVRKYGEPDSHRPLPELKPQEIPFDHPQSRCRFRDNADKPFVMTPGAIQRFGAVVICGCLAVLQELADRHDGIDYLQVFIDDRGERLWLIEDGEGGAITALLPDEY